MGATDTELDAVLRRIQRRVRRRVWWRKQRRRWARWLRWGPGFGPRARDSRGHAQKQ